MQQVIGWRRRLELMTKKLMATRWQDSLAMVRDFDGAGGVGCIELAATDDQDVSHHSAIAFDFTSISASTRRRRAMALLAFDVLAAVRRPSKCLARDVQQ